MLNIFNFAEGYTLAVVACGAALLGGVSGIVGCLALLRKQSLLADMVSHASLPGIVLAFIITGMMAHSALLIGAAAAGLCAAVQMLLMVRKSNIRQDSSLSLMLSVYFGFGMVLLSYMQHTPGSAQAGIETFLFGEAATILMSDVYIIAVVGAVICFLLLIFWKELLLVAFDPVYAAASGYPVIKLDILFTLIIVANVVIGLQTVGVVLMSALIVAPAAAARQWTNNIGIMMLIAAFFGAVSGVAGSILSSFIPRLPTGPAIIVCISLIALLSFMFAPKRGIFWVRWKHAARQDAADSYTILDALYKLSLQHEDEERHGHPVSLINSLFPLKKNTCQMLEELNVKGLAINTRGDEWMITAKGVEAMKNKQKPKAGNI